MVQNQVEAEIMTETRNQISPRGIARKSPRRDTTNSKGQDKRHLLPTDSIEIQIPTRRSIIKANSLYTPELSVPEFM